MRNMLKGLLALAGGCLTAAVVQGSAWHFYSPRRQWAALWRIADRRI